MILTREILYSKSCEMLQKKMVIYKIERLSDGKIYIGITTKTLARRIKNHINAGHLKKYVSYIDNAIQLYGIEAFEVSIVEECGSEEELCAREIYWIKTLNCKTPNGFNLTDGGKGVYGLQKKTSKPKVNKKSPHNQHAVICNETGEIFQSETSAAKWANVSCRAINNALRGKCKTAAGYHWSYLDKSNENKPKSKNYHPKKCAIICCDTGETFESITSAAEWAGVTINAIRSALLGISHKSGGHCWRYADSPNEAPRVSSDAPAEKHSAFKKLKVECCELNEIFDSVTTAAKFAGVKKETISAVLHGKLKKAGGYHWKVAAPDAIVTIKGTTPKNYRKVRCVETDEIFPTVTAAARSIGVAMCTISDVLHGRHKMAGGYHWEYVKE